MIQEQTINQEQAQAEAQADIQNQTLADISQVPGICVANAQNLQAGTGCTVIVCPEGATGSVDVRGGAPASRETDLLRPEETVQVLHAVVLSGGSAFGLAASCGVANELESRGIGLDVGVGKVPIVSSACLFDLACGDAGVRPDASMGAEATRRALDEHGPLEQGNYGAGTGCTVGKFAGPSRAMKSGLGSSALRSGDLYVGAVSAVNACGNIVDPASGRPWLVCWTRRAHRFRAWRTSSSLRVVRRPSPAPTRPSAA